MTRIRAQNCPALHPAICFLGALVLMGGHQVRADVAGLYASPLGLLRLSQKNGVITARQFSSRGPCGFKKGKVIFEGSRLDDSVTGDLLTCKVGANCEGQAKGMAMLLISKKEKIISGAVHVDAGGCNTPLGGDSIRLTKTKKTKTGKRKRAKNRSVMGKSAERTSGKRIPAKGTASPSKATDQQNPQAIDNETVKDESSLRAEAGNGAHEDQGQALSLSKSPEELRFSAKQHAREAASYLGVGNAEKARERFRDAVTTDPTYSQGYVGLGITFYQRDRYEEALEQYKKAIEVNPSNTDAYYNMACIYALQNEQEKALNFLRIALLNGYVDLATIQEDAAADFKNLAGNPAFEKLKAGNFE